MATDETHPARYISEFIYSCRTGELSQTLEILQLSSIPLETIKAENLKGLFYVSANGHFEVLKLLLKYLSKEDLNYRNEEGNTCLHWAALNGHLPIVKVLLENGSNVLARNDAGKSAATLAEERGHEEVVLFILKSYDPEEEDDVGASEAADEVVGDEDMVISNLDPEYLQETK